MASRGRNKQLWTGPALVWLILLALLAVSIASAFLPLASLNTTLNLLIAAVMIALLMIYLMDLRHANALLRILAGAGLFWTLFMFALTFADYLTRD
jgi:cytochrome c oxidase subunit 4